MSDGVLVQCRGERYYSKELAENLTQVIQDLILRFPKFTQHLDGIKGIYIYDCFKEDERFARCRDAMGLYFSEDQEIYIAANHTYNYQIAVYTLIHEIGHHIVDKRLGVDNNYNSVSKNRSYYKEEIRAEKYALFIIDRFFVKDYPIALRFLGLFNKFHRIKSQIVRTIKEYKEKMNKCSQQQPRYYYTYVPTTTTTATNYISYASTTTPGKITITFNN